MKYNILIEKRARKFISVQPKYQQQRILTAINKLPNIGDIKPISGHDNVFRLRVGDYRVIFLKNDGILLINVVEAGNRGQIYKK